jgi:hypothetical protein
MCAICAPIIMTLRSVFSRSSAWRISISPVMLRWPREAPHGGSGRNSRGAS